MSLSRHGHEHTRRLAPELERLDHVAANAQLMHRALFFTEQGCILRDCSICLRQPPVAADERLVPGEPLGGTHRVFFLVPAEAPAGRGSLAAGDRSTTMALVAASK